MGTVERHTNSRDLLGLQSRIEGPSGVSFETLGTRLLGLCRVSYENDGGQYAGQFSRKRRDLADPKNM